MFCWNQLYVQGHGQHDILIPVVVAMTDEHSLAVIVEIAPAHGHVVRAPLDVDEAVAAAVESTVAAVRLLPVHLSSVVVVPD